MPSGWCPFAEKILGVTSQAPGYQARVGFCDHIASGYLSTMKSASFWNNSGVSAHFAIGRDGSIIQMVSIFDTAWAQGTLGPTQSWKYYSQMVSDTKTKNPNAWLISTEHEGFTGEPWTPKMYAADFKVKSWCIQECKSIGQDIMKFDLESLTGHYMFDSVDRAQCPGTGWPRGTLYSDISNFVNTGGMTKVKDGWVKEGHAWILYNEGVDVITIGSKDGTGTPGQISKNFGGTWYYLIHDDGDGVTADAKWSANVGD